MTAQKSNSTSILSLMVLFLTLLACNTIENISRQVAPSGPDGYILYWHLLDDNEEILERPELVIIDTVGEEQHRIPWQDQNFPTGRYATARSGQALLFDTGEPRLFLLDAKSGDIDAVNLPPELEDGIFPIGHVPPGGDRWLFLGNARGNAAFLLDLVNGRAHDLLAANPEMEFIFSGTFNADASYFLAAGSDFWLIPTDNPGRGRSLGDDALPGSFSGDGDQFVYTRRAEADEWQVRVSRPDGSADELVTITADFTEASFIPGDDRLVLNGRTGLSIVNLDGEAQFALLSEFCRPFIFGPEGKTLLCGIEDSWQLVDLKEETAVALPALDNYTVISPNFPREANDWLLLTDEDERRFLSLNLANGETTELLTLAEGDTLMLPRPIFSPDGSYALASVTRDGREETEFWLLDLFGGPSRQLATAERGLAIATFAPNDCCLVMKIGDTLIRFDLNEEDELELGPGGSGLLWVRP